MPTENARIASSSAKSALQVSQDLEATAGMTPIVGLGSRLEMA